MFSNLSEKTKAALLYAIAMGFFLLAGSLVYFSTKTQGIVQGAINKTGDSSSTIEELYENLREKDSDNRVSLVKEIDQPEAQKRQTEVDGRWVLYVTGNVKNPGVYRLPVGARVYQLVDAAGGLTLAADAVAVNMAAHLQDGDHLHVPQKGENDSMSNRLARESHGTVMFNQNRQANDSTSLNNPRSSKNLPNKQRIDINTASAAEFQTLRGIGPSLAARIIQYRNQNGRFKQVSDLINVSGIGAKKLESIEPFLFVR